MNTLAIICSALMVIVLTICLGEDLGNFKAAVKVTCISFWTMVLAILLFKLV